MELEQSISLTCGGSGVVILFCVFLLLFFFFLVAFGVVLGMSMVLWVEVTWGAPTGLLLLQLLLLLLLLLLFSTGSSINIDNSKAAKGLFCVEMSREPTSGIISMLHLEMLDHIAQVA